MRFLYRNISFLLLFAATSLCGGEKNPFSYNFDDQGRLISVEHDRDGVKHLTVQKKYSFNAGKDAITTIFADQSSLVEENGKDGNRKRIWLDSAGKEVLCQEFEPIDAHGAFRLTQKASGKVQIIEWELDAEKHLTCVRVGKRATQYVYDAEGKLQTKKTPLHTIHYRWDGSSLMEMWSEDETLHYKFAYDVEGRQEIFIDLINQKEVRQSFDQEGRLVVDGEEGKTCFMSYDEDGGLSSIRLADGSLITYEEVGNKIYVHRGSWSAEQKEKDRSTTPICCREEKIVHKDPLGEWTEELSYDALNQLAGEKGEFNESYSFSPFGTIASKDGVDSRYNEDDDPITIGESSCVYDEDGNVIVQEISGEKTEFSYDALGRVSSVRCGKSEERYRYDALSRLQAIRFYEERELKACKELVWVGECELGAKEGSRFSELKIPDLYLDTTLGIELDGVMYSAECDARGSLIALYNHDDLVQVCRYSAFGLIHAYDQAGEEVDPISPWLYSGKRLLTTSGLYDFGNRRYDPIFMRWCEKDPLGMADGTDERMYARNNPAYFLDVAGLFAFPIEWSAFKEGVSQAYHKIISSTWKSFTFTKNQLDWFLEMRDGFEDVAFQVVGEKWSQLIGYNPDTSMEAVCGKEEKHPKARITFINGILNWSADTEYSANIVSEAHGGTAVHYVYSATQGFTNDVVRGIMAQAGVASQQAKLLASMWKRLIEEMGGVEGGGIILHYAHSLGATDTYNALHLLTPEERNMIRVTTFGGSTMICEGLCAKSENYVSTKDGVPILDLVHYISSSLGKMTNVHFLPSDSSPLLDHLFYGKTYRTVLELLGQEFQVEFGQ